MDDAVAIFTSFSLFMKASPTSGLWPLRSAAPRVRATSRRSFFPGALKADLLRGQNRGSRAIALTGAM